jgi:hypothetical protein
MDEKPSIVVSAKAREKILAYLADDKVARYVRVRVRPG